MATSRRASLSLQIVVVGGGIAGLACAYALSKAGHSIRVLEQSEVLDQGYGLGGIRVPPNMNRLLTRWGLGPQLAEYAVKCSKVNFIMADTGETVGFVEFHESVMKVLESEFLLMQYRDVHDMLYGIAVASGVEVCYKAQVTAIDPLAASVVLSSGEILMADLIIGADGYQSVVRDVVLGKKLDGVPSGLTWLTTTVSTALMKEDDELSLLAEAPNLTCWMGPGFSIGAHLVHAKERFVLQCYGPDPGEPTTESWRDVWNTEKLDVHQYEARVKKISALASKCIPIEYVIHEPFDRWVHQNNKVVLVGEAAHPLVPACTHNSAMCIEDAVTLGQLFSHLDHHDQIPSLLSAYEEIRQPRCASIQKSEKAKLDFAVLPAGPAQHARDAALRQAAKHASKDWDDVDEEFVRQEWEEFRDLFRYDAHDAADNWWVRWGILRERAAERLSVGTYVPKIHVSVDTNRL